MLVGLVAAVDHLNIRAYVCVCVDVLSVQWHNQILAAINIIRMNYLPLEPIQSSSFHSLSRFCIGPPEAAAVPKPPPPI